MVKMNNVAIVTPTRSDTWANRPGSINGTALYGEPSDGDYFQVTGSALYRYSDDIGEFVRPFVYNGTPVLDIQLSGAILPKNEDPPWILSASYQGGDPTRDRSSTDGEWVTLTHGTNNEFNIHYSHGQVGKNHFFQGHCEVLGPDGSRPDFLIKDGIRCCYLDLNARADSVRLHGTQTNMAPNGSVGHIIRPNVNSFVNYSGVDELDGPRYLEVYLASTGSTRGMLVYVDHELHPSIVIGYAYLVKHNETHANLDIVTHSPHFHGFPVASGSIYFLGAIESAGGSNQRYKECFWGRY